MRISRPARGLLAAATLVAAVAVTAGPSTATSDPKVQGDEGTLPNVDSRQGAQGAEPGRSSTASSRARRRASTASARRRRSATPAATSRPGSRTTTSPRPASTSAPTRSCWAVRRPRSPTSSSSTALPIGAGSAVLFRQRFGDIPAGRDGLVAIGVVDGKVASLSSSLATDTGLTGAVVPLGRGRGPGSRRRGRPSGRGDRERAAGERLDRPRRRRLHRAGTRPARRRADAGRRRAAGVRGPPHGPE